MLPRRSVVTVHMCRWAVYESTVSSIQSWSCRSVWGGKEDVPRGQHVTWRHH